jgi:phosphoenolpyruvate carboxykinase (GTP)
VRDQLPQLEAHLAQFGDRLPAEIRAQLEALKERLGI